MALAPRRLLLGGAVQLDEELVDVGLIQDVQADEGLGDVMVDILHGLGGTLAQVTGRVAIPELTGPAYVPGGGAGGHTADPGAVVQGDFHFHRGVAPGVQDFPAQNVNDSIICFMFICSFCCDSPKAGPGGRAVS